MAQVARPRTYYLVTYGCQMNRHDSERVAGILESRGWRLALDPGEADALVFITCCVRQSAEDRFYGRLSSLGGSKRPLQIVAVGGCVAQKEGERLLERFPFVDLVFGTAQYPRIAELLEEARERKVVALEIDGLRPTILPSSRLKTHRTWITIIEGCDNFCSYCIVPYVRGRERSRPAEEIIREAEEAVAQGAREVFLLGQNVNSYMRRETGKSRFAELLWMLAERLPGDVWIRFTTNHPRDLDRETVRALAEIPNLCKQVHLPLQAGSDRVLAAMNRGYSSKEYLKKVDLLRREVEGVSITTDLMVGFPGETEDDFRETLRMAERCAFDAAFTFMYNPREGTRAAAWADDVPRPVKLERLTRLARLTADLTRRSLEREVGKVHLALVEGRSRKDPGRWEARTSGNKPVHFQAEGDLEGKFVRLRVERAGNWSLYGSLEPPA